MRSDIWGLLGISPTGDRKAIRSAYAAQSRLHHPEEEPEYFVELNQAYRQALSLARTAEADGSSENRISRSGEEDRNSNHTEFTQLNTGTGNEKDKEESASLLERLADARQKAIQIPNRPKQPTPGSAFSCQRLSSESNTQRISPEACTPT